MVSTDRSRLVILATAGPAVLLGLLLISQWRATSCTFREAADGLYLCKQRQFGWDLQHALIRIQSREGVWPWRRRADHWVLVDAGAGDSLLFGTHASSLVKAVKRRLRPSRRGEAAGHLDLIILTHAHTLGGLPQLLEAYPDAKVAAHVDELHLLVGNPPSPIVNQSDALTIRIAATIGLIPTSEQQQGIPQDRVVELSGEGDDLAAMRQGKKSFRWLPKGVLRFAKVAGHTPGSIAVLHAPSGALLAGDAVAPCKGWLGGVSGLTVGPNAGSQQNLQAAAKELLTQEALDWRWLLPLHGGNFSRQQVVEMVRSWPDEASPPEHLRDHPAANTDDTKASKVEQPAGAHDTAGAGFGLSPGRPGPEEDGGGSVGDAARGSEF